MTTGTGLAEAYRNYHTAADQVHEKRLAVCVAESELEDAKDALALEEARLVLITEGRNAEERKANLVLLLADDAGARAARRAIVDARHELAAAQASLEREIDRRRGWGWIVRSVAGINGPSISEEG